MKRLWKIVVLVGLFTIFVLPTAAMADNENAIYVDGTPVYSDTPTYLYENYTYVPLRFISEALGADVSWEADSHTAVLDFPEYDLNIRAQIGSLYFYANGNALLNSVGSPQIRNSRTFVPLRMIAEATGATVSWQPGRIDIYSAQEASFTDMVSVMSDFYDCLGLPESALSDYAQGDFVDIIEANGGHLYTYDLGDALMSDAYLNFQINEEGIITDCWAPVAHVVYDQTFAMNTLLTSDIASLLANGEEIPLPEYLQEYGFERYWSFTGFTNNNGQPIRIELSSESPVSTLTNTQVHYTYLW